jgi:small multidrug resistance family-3 protein
MSQLTGLSALLLAALLEAGGDALMRAGLRSQAIRIRVFLFCVAAVALFLYGLTVNAPPWDFGKLLGLYIVFFFVIAQGVSWVFFHQAPSPALWVGGGLIVAGGVVIAVFQ